MKRRLTTAIESFPLARPFAISRGAKTVAVVVTATISHEDIAGRGECVPYARYGETPEAVRDTIESLRGPIEAGASRDDLQGLLPQGAARNALDSALWDFDAKRLGIRAHDPAGLHRLAPVATAYTISLDTPEAMAAAAAQARAYPILKIKLGGPDDMACLSAVHEAAPGCELIVDANEGWQEAHLSDLFAACAAAHVRLIEQPLPAGRDDALAHVARDIPVCADESIHGIDDLDALADRYDAINIKLDKTGGLTAALSLARAAQTRGFGIMVGSMVGTSLAMAPALLLAPFAQWIDLDGPLLLARDRDNALTCDGAILFPPAPELWG